MERREALKKTFQIAGTTALTPTLFSLLQSCQQTVRSDWQPTFLKKDHAQLITDLVDVMLPKTDTPGGLDMKVDIFIDLVFSKLYNTESQTSVLASLELFEEQCKEDYGQIFIELNEKQKAEVLQDQEAKSPKYVDKVWGTAIAEQPPVGFYRSLKSLILWGYFSSEEIGKNILNYDPIPGEYNGCVPLKDIGKIWSL